jgi:hypothetical protein
VFAQTPLEVDPTGVLRSDGRSVSFAPEQGPKAMLQAYLELAWLVRGLPPGSAMSLRADDLRALASYLGVSVLTVGAILNELIDDPTWWTTLAQTMPPTVPARALTTAPVTAPAPAPGARGSGTLPAPAAVAEPVPTVAQVTWAPPTGSAPPPPLPPPDPDVVRRYVDLTDHLHDLALGLPPLLGSRSEATAEEDPATAEAWHTWLSTVPLAEREQVLEATFASRRRLRKAVRASSRAKRAHQPKQQASGGERRDGHHRTGRGRSAERTPERQVGEREHPTVGTDHEVAGAVADEAHDRCVQPLASH